MKVLSIADASSGEESPEKELLKAEHPSFRRGDSDVAAQLMGQRRGGPLRKQDGPRVTAVTPEQRVLLLDTWQRSGLPAGDFAALVGVSKAHTLGVEETIRRVGPAGLMDQPRGGPKGQPAAGADQADDPDAQARPIPTGAASGSATCCSADRPCRPVPSAVARVLHEAGYEVGRRADAAPPRQDPLLRACPAQSAVADRPVHVHLEAAKPPGLSGGLHGRPQPVPRRLWSACQPVGGAGDRGAAGRAGCVWIARRDPDRQRRPVRDVAGQEPVHA